MPDANHPYDSDVPSRLDIDLSIADSARIHGEVSVGPGVRIAQGALVRSPAGGMSVGAYSMVLENCALVGNLDHPTRVGGKVVFGHRVVVCNAEVGDLCEVGNGCVIMTGARIGAWCILGEGTLIPPGATVPGRSVVVGRPGRVVRSLTTADADMIARMRGGDVSLPAVVLNTVNGDVTGARSMGKLYAYQGKSPDVAATAIIFDSAEITGDVVVGERCVIAGGVKIIGDSHGPVRIGDDVQILENTVLHLLPDNRLVIGDGVVIGPGSMIHGCEIGAGTVVEPGAIVCDYCRIGRQSLLCAGTVVKQRSSFPDRAVLDGFPARQVDTLPEPPRHPSWTLAAEELQSLVVHLPG